MFASRKSYETVGCIAQMFFLAGIATETGSATYSYIVAVDDDIDSSRYHATACIHRKRADRGEMKLLSSMQRDVQKPNRSRKTVAITIVFVDMARARNLHFERSGGWS